mgnify:CR=1 FL=1
MIAATQEKYDADLLGGVARRLASRINKPKKSVEPKSILAALHALLDGADSESREARLALQMHIAQVAERLVAGLPAVESDPMLSTEDAAQMMGCSRPYVAMLIDQDQLPGATKTAGGHRKVPQSSVKAWIAAHKVGGSADYRAAARDAGMYDVPETAYVRAAKRGKREHA